MKKTKQKTKPASMRFRVGGLTPLIVFIEFTALQHLTLDQSLLIFRSHECSVNDFMLPILDLSTRSVTALANSII